MFQLTNLIDTKYCTDFLYMSDNATEVHFRIFFGANLIFKQRQSQGLMEFMEGKTGELVEIKRQMVLRRYCLKKVRWYNLDTQERVSLDEEVLLNNIKYNVLDKEFDEGKRIGQGRKLPMKEIEIFMEEGMSLEDY